MYIPFLIEGLKAQHGPFEKEFIFINDGSTDTSLSLLENLTKDLPRTKIITQKNQGPAIALNTGLSLATGDYIKMMDGDDMLLPNTTALLLQALQDHKADFIYITPETQNVYDMRKEPKDILEKQEIREKLDVLTMNHHKQLKDSFRKAQSVPSGWFGTASLFAETNGSDPGVFIQDYSLELRLFYKSKKTLKTKDKLFLTPASDQERLSENVAQTLHDVNLGLIRFIEAHPGIPSSLREYGILRALSRARLWEKRYGEGSKKWLLFWYMLKIKCGFSIPFNFLTLLICEPFHRKHSIRVSEILAHPYSAA